MSKIKRFFRRKKRRIKRFWKMTHPVFKVSVVIFFVALAVHLLSYKVGFLADFVSATTAPVIRFVLSKITGILPFSLAETAVLMLIPLIIFVFFLLPEETKKYCRAISCIFSVFLLMYSTFVFSFATAYHGTPLSEKLGLADEPVSVEELKGTAQWLLDSANGQADYIEYNYGSFSVMPFTLSELNDKLNDACVKTAEEYPFYQKMRSKVKPVACSDFMNFTHISGIYSYYTGEANICTEYPDYTVPYTMAHEMSHQRGCAPEEDANFMAFIVSLHSDDRYILYSAYLEVFEYVSNALYKASPDDYYEVIRTADPRILYEEEAFSNFFNKYKDSAVADVTGAVNDTFLKSQGEEKGTDSYGEVVDLAVAYWKTNIK